MKVGGTAQRIAGRARMEKESEVRNWSEGSFMIENLFWFFLCNWECSVKGQGNWRW